MQATISSRWHGPDSRSISGPIPESGSRHSQRDSGSAGRSTDLYHDRGAGGPISITAAYAIVTIPLPVLAGIESDFSPPFKQAIAGTAYDDAVKLAWQSPRFWETGDHIYGGISFVKSETRLVWYPSDGFQNPNGILLGCYNTGDDAKRFGALPLADQFSRSRLAVNQLHPGHGADLAHPVAVAWQNVPFNLVPGSSGRMAQARHTIC